MSFLKTTCVDISDSYIPQKIEDFYTLPFLSFFWHRRQTVSRINIREYIIDTCDTSDCDYETAILKNDKWIVVEYYKNFKTAKKGHKKWCKFCEAEPTVVYSAQTLEIESF